MKTDILPTRTFDKPTFGEFMGTSPIMQDVYDTIKVVAPSHAPVFITGETGTGKEITAQTIHNCSKRAHKPFVAINCAALPKDLFESELFGHKAGAFTGALDNRMGAFRSAMGGTLFLDEIAELPLDLQAKLLRVLQTQYVTPLGSDKAIQTDFRLICATNQHVPKLIAEKTIREDLFHRLYILPIHLPPLNERGSDIALLAHYFTQYYSEQENKPTPMQLSPSALMALQQHHWVGNVRQLQNTIRRAVIMTDGESITRKNLILNDSYTPNNNKDDDHIIIPIGISLAHAEQTIIQNTLQHTAGNKTQTARILGIDVSTLRRKLMGGSRDAG